MKISQLKSLIKESIKEVLKENELGSDIDRTKLIEHLKYWATEFSKPDADEDEMNIDFGKFYNQFAKLSATDPLAKAYYELREACFDEIDNYNKRTIAKRIATAKKVAAMNFNAPAMQEKRKMPLKEGRVFDALTSDTAKAAYRMISKNIDFQSDTFKSVKDAVANAIKAANEANPTEMISDRDARRLLTYGNNLYDYLASMER
jgi:hypothetical protein